MVGSRGYPCLLQAGCYSSTAGKFLYHFYTVYIITRIPAQVNCLTEIFVERALARAKELDERLQATGKTIGPLHGLPISLKDQLCMKGLETTLGTQFHLASHDISHSLR